MNLIMSQYWTTLSNPHSPLDQQIILSTYSYIKLIICRNNDQLARFLKALKNFQASKAILREKGIVAPEIDHFTVVCLVAWPLNENEAGGDIVLIETSLFFLCKSVLISMRTTSLT